MSTERSGIDPYNGGGSSIVMKGIKTGGAPAYTPWIIEKDWSL